mmetsp:Transcript_3343/g.6351  ORF Transcript_3343/g.6351 Transcript_3343/m.6351 type:complete len:263 (-) Transcript_3343:238-1026(-)
MRLRIPLHKWHVFAFLGRLFHVLPAHIVGSSAAGMQTGKEHFGLKVCSHCADHSTLDDAVFIHFQELCHEQSLSLYCGTPLQRWELAVPEHQSDFGGQRILGLVLCDLHVKHRLDHVTLLQPCSNFKQDLHHASDLVIEERCSTDGGHPEGRRLVAIMGAAGLDREIPDLPHEIAHVHDVHFAEVAEVMFAHQQLRSLAHAVNVQIPLQEEILVDTACAAKPCAEIRVNRCPSQHSNVEGQHSVQHLHIVQFTSIWISGCCG